VQWTSADANRGPARSPAPEGAEHHDAALERGDDIVQHLSIAKYALTLGDTAQAMAAIDAALSSSRGSLSKLAGTSRPTHQASYAGTLVRTSAAGASAAEPTASS
jgi:hypothetical protein